MRVSEKTSHRFSRVVLPLLVGIVCAQVSLHLVDSVQPLSEIEASRFSANASVFPSTVENRILLVTVDNSTRRRLGFDDGPDPLPRQLYGRLIEGLDRAKAKAAVLDIRFESHKPDQDRLLKYSLSRLKNLKVSLVTGYTDNADFKETPRGVVGPYEPSAIYDPATMPRVRLGGGQPMLDTAGKICGAYLNEDGIAGEKRFHIAFQAAFQFLDVEYLVPKFDPANDHLAVGPMKWQLRAGGRLLTQWVKERDRIETIEFSDALRRLNKPMAKDAFAGRLVVIGDYRSDMFDSPLFGSVPGSFFIANQIGTILKPQSARIQFLDPTRYLILNSLLAAAAFVFSFSRRAILSIVGTGSLIILAWFLPFILGRWPGIMTDTLVPILAIFAAGLLGLIATQSGLYKEDQRMPGATEDATVMFLDLRGSTELLNRVGANAYRRAVEDLLKSCTRIIEHNGGTVERTLGDGFLAVFRPRPGRLHSLRCADSVEPLLAAAHAVSERHEIPFTVGIGFETGHVTGGYVSEGKRRVWSSAGVTLNLAQRLQAAGEELGTLVVVGPTARKSVSMEYETISLGPIKVKGFETMPEAATFKKPDLGS